jgi:hypothetical protein
VGPKAGLDDVVKVKLSLCLTKRKFLILSRLNSDPSAVQSIASCYTDCTTPAPDEIMLLTYSKNIAFYMSKYTTVTFQISVKKKR